MTKIQFQDPSGRKIGLLATQEQTTELMAQWVQEDHAMLTQLANEMGISDGANRWYLLALELARQAYPEPKTRGAKAKWTDWVCAALVVEVERISGADGQQVNIERTCKELAKTSPWSDFVGKHGGHTGNDPAEVLRTKYFASKHSRYAALMRQSYLFHVETDTLAVWTAYVTDLAKNP